MRLIAAAVVVAGALIATAIGLTHRYLIARGLWSPHDVQRYGLVGVAAKAADFEISEASVESITERWRRLHRSFVTKHPLIPSDARSARCNRGGQSAGALRCWHRRSCFPICP